MVNSNAFPSQRLGRMDIMNVLIQHGKNVDVTNGKNQTPLMFAIQNGGYCNKWIY